MEFLTIFLSSLITLVSPAGFVVDRVAQTTIRSQFKSVEQLEVRIDNAPSYQIVQGKADRVRVAGRGLFPIADIRLEALELETDPIHLNPQRLRRGKAELVEPLRAGVRLVIKQADIDRALRSPTVTNTLKNIGLGVLRSRQIRRQTRSYELINPQIELLSNQRVRLQTELREPNNLDTLKIFIEAGLEVVSGRQLQLIQPVIRLNGEAVPDEITASIADGIYQQSDLQQLEASGVVARLLQLKIAPQQIELAAFVQLAANQRL